MEIIELNELLPDVVGMLAGTLRHNAKHIYAPTRILRSGKMTHVFWPDGTKTTVTKMDEDMNDSPYSAFTAALAIKIFGNNSQVNRIIDRTYEEQERNPDTGKMETCNTYADRQKFRKWEKEKKKNEQKSD